VGKNDFDPMSVESLYSGAGLFFAKCLVVFTNIFEKETTLDFILEKLDFLIQSSSTFVFLEGKLPKSTLDAFRKAKANISIFELPKEKKEKFNNFLLADAFGSRDRFYLWIYFRQAMDLGVGLEELIGVLFWKAKDMILRKNFSKFKEDELKNFAGKISYLLPEARKKGLDAEVVFERFLLETV
ncbi:MAG: hypothetical protein AAB873_00975, partial [Patescibacteria group bacterium]